MVLQKVISFAKGLEDPENPLLGPTLKGLYLFGLWQTGTRRRTIAFNLFHCSTIVFVISQGIDLYVVRYDINKVLNNISLTALSIICIVKCFSYVLTQARWRELAEEISKEELLQIKKQDKVILDLMRDYTRYTRIVTFLYWVLVFCTNVLLIVSPLLKYFASQNYRNEIKNGVEPMPPILSSWFPFDNTKMPGYLWAVVVQIIMGSQGAGVIATFDMNAVAVMTYLKGQTIILREKCKVIFEGDENTLMEEILGRIKECHRHHNSLIRHYKMFNSLLSPIMYIYVLVCSLTICCSVVQFRSSGATTFQKLWVIQYTVGLVSQLFLYCWHSNEVALESFEVDDGVYSSNWWKGDVRLRKQILLLSGKLTYRFILNAGPYTTLSVPTFIDIMKGSYSFYTLFSQMQDK